MNPAEKPALTIPSVQNTFSIISSTPIALLCSTGNSAKPSSALRAQRKLRARSFRPGFAARAQTGRTCMLPGIELMFVLPFAASCVRLGLDRAAGKTCFAISKTSL
jgi:hypothetical protein